jgi:hypothetical protein
LFFVTQRKKYIFPKFVELFRKIGKKENCRKRYFVFFVRKGERTSSAVEIERNGLKILKILNG